MTRTRVPSTLIDRRRLRRDPQVVAALEARAAEAKPAAEAVARAHRVTGELEDTFGVDGTHLYTTDVMGHVIEDGSARSAPVAPLARAAEQVGARVVIT